MNKDPENKLIAVSRSEDKLRVLQDKYGEDRVGIVSGDVSRKDTNLRAIDLALSKFGQINSIIANAGVLDPVAPAKDADIDQWRRLFDINFFAVVDLIHQAHPALLKTKGNVVAVLSGASTKSYNGWGAYGSSKAALNHLIQSVVAEDGNMNAISVAPGVVDTSMQKQIREEFGSGMTPEAHAQFKSLHSNNELLPPEVPATIYVNLALKGWDKSLNGKYLRYNDEALASYSK